MTTTPQTDKRQASPAATPAPAPSRGKPERRRSTRTLAPAGTVPGPVRPHLPAAHRCGNQVQLHQGDPQRTLRRGRRDQRASPGSATTPRPWPTAASSPRSAACCSSAWSRCPVMIVLCTVLALMLESASAKWPGFFRAAYFLPVRRPRRDRHHPVVLPLRAGPEPAGGPCRRSLGLTPDFLGPDTVLWSIANIVTGATRATTCSSSWPSSSPSPWNSTKPPRWTVPPRSGWP